MNPLQIGNCRLPNRIVFPPTVTKYAHDNGTVSEPLIEYYTKIAKNGVGLTIVGGTAISRSGTPIEIVSKILLRHSRLAITQVYLGNVSDAEAIRWIDNLHG